MKKMRRTRGFTLVEVLIALVLIGVIAAGLLTFFSSGYQNILGQRNQNALNFDIQEDFETRLAKIKKDGGSGNDVETFTYRIGKNGRSNSVSVKGTTINFKLIFTIFSKNEGFYFKLFSVSLFSFSFTSVSSILALP